MSDDGRVECRICGKRFRSLGHHVRRAHDLSADEYRDQHGIRRTHSLTAPASRQRWQGRIAEQIVAGSLDTHYAGNAKRAASARPESMRVLREIRKQGVAWPSGRMPRPREELTAIVAAIEAGAARADALTAGAISKSAFYAALRRHPDLTARMKQAAGRKAHHAAAAIGSGGLAATELARIIAALHRRHPKASLLFARIAIALLDAPSRTLTISDLSDALGKGQDSTAVQGAIARMDTLGIVSRALRSADEHGGRAWAVTLLSPA